MGVKYIDWWTLGHFICGIMSTMTISPRDPWLGVLVGNIIHAYTEFNENQYIKGVLKESNENHIGDIIFFFLGSLVGILFTPITIKYWIVRLIFLMILIAISIQEWGREFKSWPFYSAFS
uniref:Uncharacterized protein n=1 Tax=Marseillevirus LCMAC101 TaxID=2506602 RepID=A0A481YRM4_9VIRU|nr:MAG: hypothetical protein LCMAC101_01720 [Marseillevirus LCMAC101]